MALNAGTVDIPVPLGLQSGVRVTSFAIGANAFDNWKIPDTANMSNPPFTGSVVVGK